MSSLDLTVESITPGSTAASNIVDDDGRVLIRKGVPLTESFLKELQNRGIEKIRVSFADFSALTCAKTGEMSVGKGDKPKQKDYAARRVDRSREPFNAERHERFSEKMKSVLEVVGNLGAGLNRNTRGTVAELSSAASGFAEMLAEDSDQSIALTSTIDRNLAARCAKLSMLAMATGLEMRLPNSDIELLGCTGLLHDLSLFDLHEKLRDPAQTLTFDEAELYRYHPERTVKKLTEFPSVSDELKVMIMQVHELPDGSGFPRGINKSRFHRLTSIMSLVELYCALTDPAPGRPPMVPYDAISFLLFQCRGGMVDASAMRSFINQLSLYGIGNNVKLSDGTVAEVIRHEVDAYDLPIVRVDGSHPEDFLPLRETNLSVIAPVQRDDEMRFDRSLVESLSIQELVFG